MSRNYHPFILDHKGFTYEWVGPAMYRRLPRAITVDPKPVSIGQTDVLILRPNQRELYMKTHRVVEHWPCPVPDCRAEVGEPCLGRSMYPTTLTHCDRRGAWYRQKRVV